MGDIMEICGDSGWVRYASHKLWPDGGSATFSSDLYGDPKFFSYFFGRGTTLTIFVSWKQISENTCTQFSINAIYCYINSYMNCMHRIINDIRHIIIFICVHIYVHVYIWIYDVYIYAIYLHMSVRNSEIARVCVISFPPLNWKRNTSCCSYVIYVAR